jgi:hypothetical protein
MTIVLGAIDGTALGRIGLVGGIVGDLVANHSKDLGGVVPHVEQHAVQDAHRFLGPVGKTLTDLSPLEQGNLLRQMDALPNMQFMGGAAKMSSVALGLSWDPIGDIKGTVKWLGDQAAKIKDQLKSLPNDAANALADSMRGPSARKLTAGEITELRKVFGNDIDLSNVRIVDGPGYNPDAKLAFDVGGNPAITEGNTVYIRHDRYTKDFSKTPGGIETLAHEFTHVRQYQKMGFGSFFAKYATDLVTAKDRNKVYDYQSRPNTTFKTETIEGQAQMVGDYAEYKAGGTNLNAAEVKDVERRLKGTGLFGL